MEADIVKYRRKTVLDWGIQRRNTKCQGENI